MRQLLLSTLCWLLLQPCVAQVRPATPRQLFPGLFEAVQLSHVFTDGKTFVDATPLQPPATILAAWNAEKQRPGFDLRQFIQAHFQLPSTTAAEYRSTVSRGLHHHLDTLWTVLQRPATGTVPAYSSLLPLPKPYLVPGGRFREVYYWDSYFTMLGLREAHRLDLVRSMVDNFAFLIKQYGFVPNGNRTYYLTRSQPPFFSLMVELLAQEQGDTVLSRYQPQLLQEYAYWMQGADSLARGHAIRRVVRLPGGELLNRYWDSSAEPREESYAEDVAAAQASHRPAPEVYQDIRAAAASGWDFSTRWFGPAGTLSSIRTTALVPVDLNCLLSALEQSIARSYAVQHNKSQAQAWQKKAKLRRKAILRYCWNPQKAWFTDFDWQNNQPAAVMTLAGVYPLTFGIATTRQAQLVAESLQKSFLQNGGLQTSLSQSGQQWDSPNAWAPLQYLAITGLNRYHHVALADTISTRWVRLNTRVFQQTGKLLEKYNVINLTLPAGGGEYPLQDGFGWTNGVLLDLLNRPASKTQ
ncbi:alpha,alpha-trehalase TreF [Hymenobacter chitinivorans]|uniref:Alpha,alpha-trehalase n=1 Tax=Hymenobacter chitinivorans DSM 11115 TaxID=1121954 RepID=A0A2M9B485_9BACT|nr:alpha,alpha-trehalase TreF [Hymenobacter chitinivorans]PJJ52757.1 alpha,alpha-trehalase [Hymenobacter chitinivorans DSM 11115]